MKTPRKVPGAIEHMKFADFYLLAAWNQDWHFSAEITCTFTSWNIDQLKTTIIKKITEKKKTKNACLDAYNSTTPQMWNNNDFSAKLKVVLILLVILRTLLILDCRKLTKDLWKYIAGFDWTFRKKDKSWHFIKKFGNGQRRLWTLIVLSI